MQMKCKKRVLSFILCMMLTVAMAFCTIGCNGSSDNEEPVVEKTADGSFADGDVLGEGESEFTLTITDQDGKEIRLEIHTDKETVGEALLDLGVIEGDEGDYGLYVKTVNNITADYDKDGVYWAFYINDEYAQTGVDSTPIVEGESYSLKIE